LLRPSGRPVRVGACGSCVNRVSKLIWCRLLASSSSDYHLAFMLWPLLLAQLSSRRRWYLPSLRPASSRCLFRLLQRYKASVQVLCTPPHSTTWPTHTVVVVQQTPLKRGIILWERPKESASQPASLPHLPKPPHGSCDFITQPTRGPIRAQLAAISISRRAWLSVWHPTIW
jgi:hypothetical protein